MPEHNEPGIIRAIVLLHVILHKLHHLGLQIAVVVLIGQLRVEAYEMRPARVKRVPQTAGVPRHLEPIHVVQQSPIRLVVALGHQVGHSAGQRLHVPHEQVASSAVVVVVNNGIVLVRADFLHKCLEGGLVGHSCTHVAENQHAGDWVLRVVALRLEYELLRPAVGLGAHAVGVQAALGQVRHVGLAHVQVSLEDLRVVHVREGRPDPGGGGGVRNYCLVVGGNWSVFHRGAYACGFRGPGHGH